jgi:hypothetical protein
MNRRERLAFIATLKQGDETACLAVIETIEAQGAGIPIDCSLRLVACVIP